MSRDLDIPGLVNARDLGGLTTHDGSHIARGRVIRAESLAYLAAQGERDLIELVDPRTVLDLREYPESRNGSYTLTACSAQVVNLPMRPLAAITEEEIAAGQPTTLVEDYLGQLEVNIDALAEAVRVIADPRNHPVVVHCTSGKDRTGVLTALVLCLVGVPDGQIAEDYALTARVIPVLIDRVRQIRAFTENGLAMAPEWVFSADAETMLAFLEGLRQRHGGPDGWAARAGLPASISESLRSALLE
jgi:protein tyrosine/serine phosphatase